MLNQLTTLIREKYLNLEKKKNEKTNIEIHLYQTQKEITELEKNIAELGNDREFYALVNLYNVYKNYDFPQNILDIIMKRITLSWVACLENIHRYLKMVAEKICMVLRHTHQ